MQLDLVDRNDQITFEIGLDDKLDKQELLDVFRVEKDYEQNDKMWRKLRAEILGESDDSGSESDDESGSDSDSGGSRKEDADL